MVRAKTTFGPAARHDNPIIRLREGDVAAARAALFVIVNEPGFQDV
jgi:hypothetical protein